MNRSGKREGKKRNEWKIRRRKSEDVRGERWKKLREIRAEKAGNKGKEKINGGCKVKRTSVRVSHDKAYL